MSETDNEQPKAEKQEKTMAERAQEVGRDGAYLELDARSLVKAFKDGELQKAAIVVVTSSRIELSAPSDVGGLSKAVQNAMDKAAASNGTTADSEYAGLSGEQLSLLVFRKLLSAGLSNG
jgi:hypothetical protein